MVKIMIRANEIKILDINSLIPHPKNPNKHSSEQIERLARIIEYQGFRNPVIIQKGTNLIVAGHGRTMAAKKLGLKQVPVIEQEFESEAQLYAYVVSDNAIAEWADLDLSEINKEMLDLGPDFEIEMLGLKDFTIEPIEKFDPLTDEDEIPEVVHPITRKGDIWLLGNHRLMCGDSTMIDDVERLMGGEKADMVFTDPPYGMRLDADYSKMGEKGKKWENIKGDHEDFNDDFINNVFGFFGYVKEVFLWGADYYAQLIPNRNEGNFICWDKTLKSNGDGDKSSEFELLWTKQKHKREVIHFNWFRYFGLHQQDQNKRLHPTQKPLQVITPFIENYSKENNIIIDLFLGSGSTLIACEKTNRKCYAMELDEKYCDVIINRWQNFTGKKATLELAGQTYEELKLERGDK
jgi:DNA modification methylase